MGVFAGAMTADYSQVTFQRYAATKARLVCKIPDSMAYKDTVPNGKIVVIWGGSSSIGTSTT
ncbi:hypothetical protein GMORB2_3466 [Geosmithia morbida]|uniref:Uncharacterized protein n=1 Tax=Geosmithia morbida TaxID=1094350 RepID=A0A9P4YQB0_9HYPO|nr:uncharacterized protein GMORB2_3466 [Geosmithia morbida]KAF4120055.1 hypothetical protein GMORB2_3466 [Geosmithia morbida]